MGTNISAQRALVHHTGVEGGGGVWKCSRDKGTRCEHIKLCVRHLDELESGIVNVDGEEDIDHSEQYDEDAEGTSLPGKA